MDLDILWSAMNARKESTTSLQSLQLDYYELNGRQGQFWGPELGTEVCSSYCGQSVSLGVFADDDFSIYFVIRKLYQS